MEALPTKEPRIKLKIRKLPVKYILSDSREMKSITRKLLPHNTNTYLNSI